MKRGVNAIRTAARHVVLLSALTLATFAAAAEHDPLPSWRDGAARQAILAFVADVTTPGGPRFVPPHERIAVFDHDGTLWSEKPWVGGLFLEHLIRRAAEKNPALAGAEPYRAALANDRDYFEQGGFAVMQDAVRSIRMTMPREEFDAEVRLFLATARHPALGVPLRQTVYQPSLELLAYLRANGFTTFICSGGEIDFMRVFARDFYGIDTWQVIGTSYRKELDVMSGRAVLDWTGEIGSFNNKDQKAVNIDLHIGQRPLLVMGNAGGAGDIGMMAYSAGRDGPSLQLMISHDDGEREFAYAEPDNLSLETAKQRGWVIVSMKADWATIHAPSATAASKVGMP